MLNVVLSSVERVALAVILGGGLIMAAGVRPLLLRLLADRKSAVFIETVEGLSIGAWNRYNRFAFMATVILLGVDTLKVSVGLAHSYWRLALVAVMLICLLAKFVIDRQLKRRIEAHGVDAVGDRDQNRGHRRVELLSKFVLSAAAALMILPF